MEQYKLYNDAYVISLEMLLHRYAQSIQFFTLTEQIFFPFRDPVYIEFSKRMEEYYIASIKTKDWFSFHTRDCNPFYVNCYRFEKNMMDIFTDYVYDIFLRNDASTVSPLPEDLCLFRGNGSMLLGTVSHESTARLYLTTEERESGVIEGFVPCKNEDARIAPIALPLVFR